MRRFPGEPCTQGQTCVGDGSTNGGEGLVCAVNTSQGTGNVEYVNNTGSHCAIVFPGEHCGVCNTDADCIAPDTCFEHVCLSSDHINCP